MTTNNFSNIFFQKRGAVFGTIVLLIIFFMATFGPYFNHFSYFEIHLELKNCPPSSVFWFGSDELGRDIFTRIWHGARISLLVGITAAVIDLIIGVIWGSIAALCGGYIDEIMMRIADILHSIPHLLTVILLIVILGPGLFSIIIALTITGWINMARIVRGQMLQLKEMDFIYAARAIGLSGKRIIAKHLIPNAGGSIIAAMTLTIPSAIFTEAFLSFMGLGVQAPIASWGVMINDALTALRYYPWRLFFPGIMITITTLSFNLIGDGLQTAFNPRNSL